MSSFATLMYTCGSHQVCRWFRLLQWGGGAKMQNAECKMQNAVEGRKNWVPGSSRLLYDFHKSQWGKSLQFYFYRTEIGWTPSVRLTDLIVNLRTLLPLLFYCLDLPLTSTGWLKAQWICNGFYSVEINNLKLKILFNTFGIDNYDDQ